MEFKRRGILQANQFHDAIKNVDVTNPTQKAQAIAAAKQMPRKNEKSFFRENALKAIKQVAAYSIDHWTRYAVLFDWDVLVFVKFPENSLTAPAQPSLKVSAGEYCELTVIPHTTESHLMRPALLGFMAEAYNETPAN